MFIPDFLRKIENLSVLYNVVGLVVLGLKPLLQLTL